MGVPAAAGPRTVPADPRLPAAGRPTTRFARLPRVSLAAAAVR